jgi:hypothetical protein
LQGRSLQSTDAGLLCEGGWLAPLSCRVWHTMPQCAKDAWSLREPARTHTKAKWKWGGNCASPDLAKQAGRACAMGPNCLVTSRAALALHAKLPQAETWSCLTLTLSIDKSHASSGTGSVGFRKTRFTLLPSLQSTLSAARQQLGSDHWLARAWQFVHQTHGLVNPRGKQDRAVCLQEQRGGRRRSPIEFFVRLIGGN